MDNEDNLWIPIFIRELRSHGLINRAATTAGVTRRRVDKMREQSAEFDYQVTDALEESADALELEARRRAVEGVEKGVYYQGALMNTETVYSDSLLTTLLKAKRADEFAERKQISGAGGGPVTVLVRSFGEAPPHPATLRGSNPPIDAEFKVVPPPAADVALADVLDMV